MRNGGIFDMFRKLEVVSPIQSELFFFDIDSTTYIHAIHDNPESTKVAFKKLKEQGKKLFICTSRSYEEMCMLPKDFLEVMDGIICLMGAHTFIGEEQAVVPMDESVKDCIAYLDSQGITYRYVTEEGHGYLNKKDEEKEALFYRLYQMVPPIKPYENETILHLLCYPQTEEQKKYINEHFEKLHVTILSFSTEITQIGIDKGNALEKVATMLGVDIENTVAFGDAANDISMLQKAGVGIAMGNGVESCKLAADYVTDAIEEDGLYNACVHFEWI